MVGGGAWPFWFKGSKVVTKVVTSRTNCECKHGMGKKENKNSKILKKQKKLADTFFGDLFIQRSEIKWLYLESGDSRKFFLENIKIFKSKSF